VSLKPKIALRVTLVLAILSVGVAVWLGSRHPTKPASIEVKETLRHDLIQKENRWYHQGQTNPFTGVMVDYYPGGSRLSRCEVLNGLLNGRSESWYTNGQLQVREYFKDGVSNGPREKWHENGLLLSKADIIEGKVNGTFRSWHDNGKLNEEIPMKLGKPDGLAWAYYPSGFVKAETTVRDGQILDRKTWKDGEQTGSLPGTEAGTSTP
jgi:antitoxin component YwqK of YwqJK toxin-antitoxin module